MIRHVVLFKARKDASPQEIASAYAALAGLKETVPGILHFAIGPNASPEGMNRGYDHGFTIARMTMPIISSVGTSLMIR